MVVYLERRRLVPSSAVRDPTPSGGFRGHPSPWAWMLAHALHGENPGKDGGRPVPGDARSVTSCRCVSSNHCFPMRSAVLRSRLWDISRSTTLPLHPALWPRTPCFSSSCWLPMCPIRCFRKGKVRSWRTNICCLAFCFLGCSKDLEHLDPSLEVALRSHLEALYKWSKPFQWFPC